MIKQKVLALMSPFVGAWSASILAAVCLHSGRSLPSCEMSN